VDFMVVKGSIVKKVGEVMCEKNKKRQRSEGKTKKTKKDRRKLHSVLVVGMIGSILQKKWLLCWRK